MDECEQLRLDVLLRKKKQNERRVKAGKKPVHKEKKPKKSAARAGLPLPESGLVEDSAMSFEDWKVCGYAVKKGSKAIQFGMDGTAWFDMTQVQRINPAWAKWRKRQ